MSPLSFSICASPIQTYDADDLSRYRSYNQAILAGARTTSFVIDTAQEDRVFGIQFHPAGAFPFSRAPACEMENRTVELEYLWRGSAGELRERLLAAPTIEAMFRLAEQYLFAVRVKPLELHPAVEFARQQFCSRPHKISVASVLDKVGLSQRCFIQVFHEQIGHACSA